MEERKAQEHYSLDRSGYYHGANIMKDHIFADFRKEKVVSQIKRKRRTD